MGILHPGRRVQPARSALRGQRGGASSPTPGAVGRSRARARDPAPGVQPPSGSTSPIARKRSASAVTAATSGLLRSGSGRWSIASRGSRTSTVSSGRRISISARSRTPPSDSLRRRLAGTTAGCFSSRPATHEGSRSDPTICSLLRSASSHVTSRGSGATALAEAGVYYLRKHATRHALVGQVGFRGGHNLDPEIQLLLGAERRAAWLSGAAVRRHAVPVVERRRAVVHRRRRRTARLVGRCGVRRQRLRLAGGTASQSRRSQDRGRCRPVGREESSVDAETACASTSATRSRR